MTTFYALIATFFLINTIEADCPVQQYPLIPQPAKLIVYANNRQKMLALLVLKVLG